MTKSFSHPFAQTSCFHKEITGITCRECKVLLHIVHQNIVANALEVQITNNKVINNN